MGVMTTIAAVSAVAGIGSSIARGISENNKAKAYQDALNNYERQELKNPYENLQVSRAGTDLALQENSRNSASMVDALQRSGINGLAMLPQIQAGTNTLNQQVVANLDQQYINNENKKAEGEGLVMQMQERREEGDLAGLGNAMSVAQNNANQSWASAINNGITGAMSIGGMMQNKQYLNSMNQNVSPLVEHGNYGVSSGLQINPAPTIQNLQMPTTNQALTPQGTMASFPQQQSYYLMFNIPFGLKK